jgi:hypothetical protein
LILKGTTNFDNGTLLSNGSGTITASNTLTIQALSSGTQQTMLQIVPGTNSSLATIQLPTVLGDVDTAPGFSTRIGTNLRNTGDVGIESASYLTLGGEQGFLLKQNNYFDGSNHRFASANTAYFWDLGGSLSGNNGMLSWRQSTNTPVTNGVITWGSWNLVNANTANNATTAATATNVSSGFVSCTTINATGIASIAGVTTLASNANVGGTFSTTGNATLNSNLVVSGTAGISGVTTLASNANVGGTFSTTGAVSLPSTATIGSVSVTGNEHVNGTSVIAGAGTAFSVTNSATIGQDLNVFGNLTLTNGPGTFNRLFANIQVADNNAHIYTNSDHGNLVVTKSDGTTTIASFNDTTGLNVTGSVTLNGAATNKISSNNIVQGSIFNGSSSSTTANQTFNHNFNSANGNPLAVYLIDITGTQPAQQFVIVSITSTQVTFKSSGTGSFTGFAVRA